VTALAVFAPFATLQAVSVIGDYVRLVAACPIYASGLVAMPAAAPRFAAFDWGGMGFAGVGEPDIYIGL
jgi:hypothetical protein